MTRTPSTVYLLDANVLIDAHNKYYAIDMVPEFWDWLLHSANGGDVAMPLETFEEVRGGADAKKDLLNEWLCRDEVEEALVLAEDVDTGILARVMDAYAPDLTDSEVEQVGRDPFSHHLRTRAASAARGRVERSFKALQTAGQ